MTIRKRLTTKDREAVSIWTDGCCVDCGSDKGPFDIDHIVPLALGGADNVSNMRLRCRGDCHREKTKNDVSKIRKADRVQKKHKDWKHKGRKFYRTVGGKPVDNRKPKVPW